MSLLLAGGRNWMIFKVPSNSNYATINKTLKAWCIHQPFSKLDAKTMSSSSPSP